MKKKTENKIVEQYRKQYLKDIEELGRMIIRFTMLYGGIAWKDLDNWLDEFYKNV